jgi:hypothetical protein
MGITHVITQSPFPTSTPQTPTVDMMESSGSLMLIDPGHSSNPWGDTLPASGVGVPNLVKATADTILTQTTPNPVLSRSATSGKGKVELSARGGLHVAQNELATSYGDASATIAFPPAIASYLSSNYSHDYFVGAWIRNTGAGASYADNNPVVQLQSATEFGISLSSGFTRFSSKNRNITYSGNVGNHRVNALIDSIPSSWGQTFLRSSVAALGNAMGDSASDYGKVGSYILYRIYIEDLTVSGRTYEQLEALDAKAHAQAFGTGGRYAGDTYTNPGAI